VAVLTSPRLRAVLPVGRVAPAPEEATPPDHTVEPSPDAADLTRQALVHAVEKLGCEVRVTGSRRWWDGDAWVPLLTVRLAGRPAWVVESVGGITVLPAHTWTARRVLRRSRSAASGSRLAAPGSRHLGSIAVGAPTRSGVELVRGALSGTQRRQRLAARRRAALLASAADGELPGQLGLFDAEEAGAEPLTAPAVPGMEPRDVEVPLVRIVQSGDVRRCPQNGCGGLVPIPDPGVAEHAPAACPACSRH
jgi:hypothetical protein